MGNEYSKKDYSSRNREHEIEKLNMKPKSSKRKFNEELLTTKHSRNITEEMIKNMTRMKKNQRDNCDGYKDSQKSNPYNHHGKISKRKYSNESENGRHHKHSTSATCHHSSKKLYHRKRSDSNDSGHYHHYKYAAANSKNLNRETAKSISLFRDDSNHHRLSSVIEKKKNDEKKNYDSEIKYLGEKEAIDHNHRSRKQKFLEIYNYETSGNYIKKERPKQALSYIEEALRLCKKDNSVFLSKLYSRRGIIYSLLEKPRSSFQGFLDWEHAYILNEKNAEAKKCMAKYLFIAANKLFKMKNYEKAMNLCLKAVELNEHNKSASELLNILQKKKQNKHMEHTRDPVPSTSNERRNPTKASKHNRDDAVFKDIGNAVEKNNLPRALILINKALKKYQLDEKIFKELLILKQRLLKLL